MRHVAAARASQTGSGQRLEPEFARKPLSPDEVWAKMAPKNEALREAGHAELLREEVVGGRLYTGPMYVRYNAVLRQCLSTTTYSLLTTSLRANYLPHNRSTHTK